MVLYRRRPETVIRHRPGRDVGHLTCARIPPAHMSAEPRAIDDVWILRVGNIVIALIAADRVPIAPVGRAIVAAAGDRDRSAVLLSRVDPVREAIVCREMIELAGRLIVPAAPSLAAVDRNRRPLVRARGEASRIARVDPD